MPVRLTAFAALAIFALTPHPALANRIISATIAVDGKSVLVADGFDNGDAPIELVWRRLASMEFAPAAGAPAAGAPAVAADPADPLRATLKGDIEVRVNQGKARVKELRLVRRSDKAGWSVHPQDVEATAKLAGYEVVPAWTPTVQKAQPPEPDAEKAFVNWVVIWVVAVIVLVAAVVAIVRITTRRPK